MKEADQRQGHGLRRRESGLEAVERITEIPLLVLSVAMLPLVLVPLVIDLDPSIERALFATDWMIWAVFAIELSVRTYLAPKRPSYLVRHWFDVVIVVVPFLRPLRVLRSARLLRVLRVGRGFAYLARAIHAGRDIAGRYGLQYALLVGFLFVFGCAGAVTLVERNSGGNINDFGTGLWWAATTVTTVGYGDTYPRTVEGRGFAVLLMLVGITLFGLLTASIAAYFVDTRREGEPTIQDLADRLERMERLLHQLAPRTIDGSTAPDSNE